MGDFSGRIDVEKLISYSDDLVNVLKDNKDTNRFTQLQEQSKTLQSSCNGDLNEVQSLLEDHQKKIDEWKKKAEEAKSEVAEEAEIDNLRNELDQELVKERAFMEELRTITDEIADLESQRTSIEQRKQIGKKLEQQKLRQEMMLSMYASVTKVIPNLDDQSIISGHIVDRDKKLVEKFEFDSTKGTAFENCHSIWKKINFQ
ncbi:hypothetical protein CFOL_v3_17079 [Cephalotus follicularis]|uniref:Kinetochore protein Spc24 n=1 Tax=Cephalotus follicularis TaxID=3775 RepID=A0A1Q3BZZ2_CEPFO|nr:hypothetical protein CFOL_v3_17079 [Cephalotus follicularis]